MHPILCSHVATSTAPTRKVIIVVGVVSLRSTVALAQSCMCFVVACVLFSLALCGKLVLVDSLGGTTHDRHGADSSEAKPSAIMRTTRRRDAPEREDSRFAADQIAQTQYEEGKG